MEEGTLVGAAYANPQSADFPLGAVQAHYADLFEHVLDAIESGSLW